MRLFSRKPKEKSAASESQPVVSETLPTSRSELSAELSAWIAENPNNPVDPESINPKRNLYAYGYLDSMRGADFLVFVEKRYKLYISEADLVGRLSTLEAVVDELHAHLKLQ